MDARHLDTVQRGKVRAEQVGVAPFAGEIQLVEDFAPQLLDHRRGPHPPHLPAARLRHGRQMAHEPEVRLHPRANARAADLHHHFGAILQHRPVDLCDRGCRQRLGIEPGKRGFRRLAQRGLHFTAQRLERQARRIALELLEGRDPCIRQQIAPGRENLAELHVSRPQRLQRAARARRQVARLMARIVPFAEAQPHRQRLKTEPDDHRRHFGHPRPVPRRHGYRLEHASLLQRWTTGLTGLRFRRHALLRGRTEWTAPSAQS